MLNFQRIPKVVKMTHLLVDPLVREYIEIGQELHKALGLDNLSYSIIGILFLEPGEICMEELAQMTGYSLPSVSQKLKFLTHYGIIKRRTKPGSRKVYLSMDKDLFKMLKQEMTTHYLEEINIVKEELPSIIEKYEKPPTDQKQKERLEILKKYYNQTLQFEEILNNLIEKMEELEE